METKLLENPRPSSTFSHSYDVSISRYNLSYEETTRISTLLELVFFTFIQLNGRKRGLDLSVLHFDWVWLVSVYPTITATRLYRFSWNWESTYLIKRHQSYVCVGIISFPSRSIVAAIFWAFFAVTVKRIYWLIVMSFRINVIGSSVERRMYKYILFPSGFKMATVFWVFFAVRSNALTSSH